MIPVVEFFENLPEKYCARCGSVIQEQADCYNTVCHECADARNDLKQESPGNG